MKRLYILTLFIPLMITAGYAFNLTKNIPKHPEKSALLLIDIQEFYFSGGFAELSGPVPAAEKAAKILKHFRDNKQPVIHIKHKSGKQERIHPLVKASTSEKVILKEKVNAYVGTDLLGYLKSNRITRLVIVGMQTHMCVEAATRASADYGFKCTVISDACATRDLKFDGKTVKAADVHASTLATLKSYAKIKTAAQYLAQDR